MDGGEVHAHPKHTGHRFFDFVVSGAALLVSAISLWVAVHHGETMERLVQANSMPNIEFDSTITKGEAAGAVAIALSLNNTGVGPGRIETIEVWNGSTPVAAATDIGAALKAAAGGQSFSAQLDGSSVRGSLIGAAKSRTLVRYQIPDGAAWVTPAVKVSNALQGRICYCSVFDECYVTDTRANAGRPSHVKECVAPPHPYNDDIGHVLVSAQANAPKRSQ